MSVPLIVNGVTYNYPVQGDTNWGPVLTNWSTAVTNALQTSSNNFTLLTNHSIIFKDSEGTPKSLTLGIPSPLTASWSLTLPVDAGTSGQVLSTNGSGVTSWINAAGGGTVNSGTTGQLAYYPGNGTTISGETMSGDATIAVGGALTIANSAITNVKVAAAAAIAVNKLAALTASRAVVTDGSGFLTSATTTATEIGFVNGVTSSIQNQINTLGSTYLPLAGGTMSGAINMGSHKITSLTAGSGTGEAVNFDQLPTLANSQTNVDNGGSALLTLSTTVTATGTPLLLTGHVSVNFTTDGSGNLSARVFIAEDGLGFTGSVLYLLVGGLPNSTSQIFPFSFSVARTPSAGSHTYTYRVIMFTGTLTTTAPVAGSLVALKL